MHWVVTFSLNLAQAMVCNSVEQHCLVIGVRLRVAIGRPTRRPFSRADLLIIEERRRRWQIVFLSRGKPRDGQKDGRRLRELPHPRQEQASGQSHKIRLTGNPHN